MLVRLVPFVFVFAICLAPARAADQASLDLSFRRFDLETLVIADLVVPDVPVFYLFMSSGQQFSCAGSALVGVGHRFDAHRSRMVASVSNAVDLSRLDVTLSAFYRDPLSGKVVSSRTSYLGTTLGPSETLSFEFGADHVGLPAGTQVAEQWAPLGIHVSATNNWPGHPNKALIFDSAHFTGEDSDLQTPGYGSGNNLPFGNLLIIAEDDVDLDHDGLVDDPDDNQFGGVIDFHFDWTADVRSATLIDVDANEHVTIRGFDINGNEVGNVLVQALDDNSRQTVDFFMSQVSRVSFEFAGSGGIGELAWVPCPDWIDFDHMIAGDPLGYPAGKEITDQFAGLGVHFSAVNAVPGHPNKLILFDTGHVTGGDTDLVAPGYGANNTVPRGMVLIIAENDIDMDHDGIVDDPDDQEFGGVVTIDFDVPVTFEQVSIMDIEDPGSYWQFYDSGNNLLLTVPLAGLGDNSVQTLTPNQCCVSRAVLHVFTSMAIDDLRFCPQENYQRK